MFFEYVPLKILRFCIYVWIALETAILGFLYGLGYREMKKSPIIRDLRNFLILLSLFFGTLSLIPLTDYLLGDTPTVFGYIMIIITIPLGFLFSRFRENSLVYTENEIAKKARKDAREALNNVEGGDTIMNEKIEYPVWKLVAWRYLRVFVSSFIVTFGGVLAAFDGAELLGDATIINIGQFLKTLWALAIYPGIIAGATAGISAIGKLFRERFGDKRDYSSLIDKLPF